MRQIDACPKCRNQDSVWYGYRYNKSGVKRLKKCKGCGAKFTPDDGFLRRRFQKKHIIEAVSLHKGGLSLGKVKEYLQQHHKIEVSRWMISLWCRDYLGTNGFAESDPEINTSDSNIVNTMIRPSRTIGEYPVVTLTK